MFSAFKFNRFLGGNDMKCRPIFAAVVSIFCCAAFGMSDVPQYFENAQWVAPAPYGSSYEIANAYNLYRRAFALDAVPKSAPMSISADQNYRLYINGEFVCSGPARGFYWEQPFDEIDVAKYLKRGRNVIAIRQYCAGRGTFAYIPSGHSGAIFALDLGDGKLVLSDDNTKGRRQTGCRRDTAQLSIPMNNQEHIDLRAENPDWLKPDFDDSAWARCYTRVRTALPYSAFERRTIPMLDEREVFPQALVSEGAGTSGGDSENVFDVSALFDSDKIEFNAVENGAKFAVSEPSDGVRAFVFDFGAMSAGMPILKIEGANGGEIVDIRATELLDSNNADTVRCGSSLAPANRLICRAGTQVHEFYQLLGFRYLAVRVRNNASATLKITPSMRWSTYPLGERGKFECSDALAEKIWRASVRTQRVCSLDSYVDTPYREQAQWWGDARVQGWNTFFISGDARLLRRGIKSISMQKTPDGLTHGYAPDGTRACVLPDYSLIWILTVWDYYWQTADPEPYIAHRDTVRSIFDYFDKMSSPETGLGQYDNRYWLFLDWCKMHKAGQPAVLNLWLLHAYDKMRDLCIQNGFTDDARDYAVRGARLRSAIIKNLLRPDGLVSDGIFPDGRQNPNTGIHAQTLAKICEIGGFDFKKALETVILPYVETEGLEKAPVNFSERMSKVVKPSSYWAVYILQVLVDAGCEKQAYDYILRMWAEFADYGSVGEMFNVPDTSTHSHAWSAHPAFLLPRILGGVRQESAGWKKVSFKPNRFGDFAKVVYPTPQGEIKVSWRKNDDGTYTDKIDLPAGVELSDGGLR